MRSTKKKRVVRYRSPGYGETLLRVAANVRHLREARAWTQEEVCSRAESMSERLYRLVEAGKTNVTAATLTRLAEAFDVDVAVLLAPVRSASARTRPKQEGSPVVSLAPTVVASLLLDPLTLQDPAVLAALDVLIRRRREPGRVRNPSARAEGDPPGQEAKLGAHPGASAADAGPLPGELPTDGARASGGVEVRTGSRVTTSVISIPAVPKGADLRTFVIALLVANPRGLLTSEMAEAAASAKRRHRKNEIHEVVRSLQESGDVTRTGRRGSFVYALRTSPTRMP